MEVEEDLGSQEKDLREQELKDITETIKEESVTKGTHSKSLDADKDGLAQIVSRMSK